MTSHLRLLTFLAVLSQGIAIGSDWPQFLGPQRNGVYPGPAISVQWESAGPKELWKRSVGEGFAGPVVVEGRLILFHRRGGEEVVESVDALSGKPQWEYKYATTYRDDFGFDEGPRSAPTVADKRVYTFGAQGVLHCLEVATGKKVWSMDTRSVYKAEKGFFGAASPPLVDEGKVIVNVGGRDGAGVVALDAATGKPLWHATNDEASYSAPVAATIGGRRHIFVFTRNGIVDLDPVGGSVRFSKRWRSRSNASVNAAAPLLLGDLLFVSASYGTGAILLRLTGDEPEQVWASDDVMSNHYATCVIHEGHLYGYHGRQEMGPSLRCVELNTGSVKWSEDGFRAGTVTLAGGQLLLMRESGELVVASATPRGFRPEARAKVIDGTVRAYPALADGRFFVRNESTLVALQLENDR